jgi:Protein of unknown function (DUF3500)
LGPQPAHVADQAEGGLWAWRFEGHHLSITATITGTGVVVAPLFLGANPARVHSEPTGTLVLGPVLAEEDLARRLITSLPAEPRAQALISEQAPLDLITSTRTHVEHPLLPTGIHAADLPGPRLDQLGRLIDLYLDRLPPELATLERRQLRLEEATLAWAGGFAHGQSRYYRLQTPRLLIEYAGSGGRAGHAHTVLRRPGNDFGHGLIQGG